MADQSVKINVGSSYDGSGTAKAMTAVDKLSKTAGRAASAVGSLAGAFGGMSGEAGKAVGAISKFAGAFASGGTFGLAIAGITTAVGLAAGIFKNYKDEAEKAAKVKFDSQMNSLKNINGMVKTLTGSYQQLATATKAVNTSYQNAKNQEADIAETKIHALAEQAKQKGDNVLAAQIEAEAAKVSSTKNVGIAKTNAANAKEQYNTDVKSKNAADAAVKRLRENVQALKAESLKEFTFEEKLNDLFGVSGAADERDRRAKLLSRAEQELAKAEEAATAASKKVTESWNNLAAANKQYELAQEKAKLADEKAQTAIVEAQKKKEKEDAEAQKKKKQADDEAIGKQHEEIQKEHDREKAEEDYLRKEYIELIKQQVEDKKKELETAKEALKEAQKATQRAEQNASTWLSQGYLLPSGANLPDKIAGWSPQKIQRWADTHPWEARAIGLETGLTKGEQNEMDELMNKALNGNLTDADKKRLRQLNAKDPEQVARDAATAEEKMNGKLDGIKQELEDVNEYLKSLQPKMG